MWYEWDLKAKDFLVEELVVKYLEQRLIQELNQNPYSEEFNEVSGMELTSMRECLDAYVKFYCRFNFPSCDPDLGTTVPVCLGDCEAAHSNCGMLPDVCVDTRVFRNIGDGSEPSCDPE